MPLEVICAGFGRTGTNSLYTALNKLGFPSHHMVEIMNGNSEPDPFIAAELGEPVDWDKVFTNYRATTDWPSVRFWEQLIKKYPNAKVILTYRDPESWYKSCTNTIFTAQDIFKPPYSYGFMSSRMRRVGKMIRMTGIEGDFKNRINDKDFIIEKFNQHNERVKKVVEPERLLVYHVKEGWEPLCKFLGVPIPNEPFPNVNDTAQFKRRIRFAKFMILGMPILASILVAVVAVVISRSFQ